MKWKCIKCLGPDDPYNEGCTIDVPHLDASVAGPPLCPWAFGQEAVWKSLDDPIDEAATPRACFWCDEPALVNDIGLCHRCEMESEHDHAN